MTTGQPVPALVLLRTIAAPAAEVFAAWTDARLLARWLAPEGCAVADATADARVGGAYRIAVRDPAGDVHVTTGEYRELVPASRIVMTWRYAGPNGDDPAPSVLTVTLRALAERSTELTLRHEKARDARARELLAAGWPSCLDKLAALLAPSAGAAVR